MALRHGRLSDPAEIRGKRVEQSPSGLFRFQRFHVGIAAGIIGPDVDEQDGVRECERRDERPCNRAIGWRGNEEAERERKPGEREPDTKRDVPADRMIADRKRVDHAASEKQRTGEPERKKLYSRRWTRGPPAPEYKDRRERAGRYRTR